MQSKDTTKAGEPTDHTQTLETLREVYYRRAEHPDIGQGVRKELTQSINMAAKYAKLAPDCARNRADVYADAVAELDRGTRHSGDIGDYIDQLCEQIRQGWERAAAGEIARVSRLPEHLYLATFTLSAALDARGPHGSGTDDYRMTTKKEREAIERDVTALCIELKIDHMRMDYHHASAECFKRLGGDESRHPLAASLYKLAEKIRQRAKAARESQSEKDEKPTAKKNEYVVRLFDPAGIIGYAAGECLAVEEAARSLKVGDPASAWADEDDNATSGRVVAADADTFTIREDDGEETTFNRRTCAWAGRVTGTCSRLARDEQERVEQIKKALEKLGDEDDQILRCTAGYKLEKELFDIEHPITRDGEDSNDWGAWEEKEQDKA
jgi:hypothetical protein